MDTLENQMVSKAAAMAAAVSAAYAGGLRFSLPGMTTNNGSTVNINTSSTPSVYEIRKALTDAANRTKSGVGIK